MAGEMEISNVRKGGPGPVDVLPVNTSNPFIWDNDTDADTFTQEFVMALANNGTINLIGISLSPHPYNGGKSEDLQAIVLKARHSGWKNIPDATWDLGNLAMTALSRPASGNIDGTDPLDTAPARMIRDQVLKAGTPSKPVVIGAGGALTTVASGYLLAKQMGKAAEFASKVIVMADSGGYNGVPSMNGYNTGQDEWASYICLARLKYIVVSFPDNHVGLPMIWDFIDTLPDNELTRYMRAKKGPQWPYADLHGDGDAGVVLAFLRPRQGDYFNQTTGIAFDHWGSWPAGWGKPGPQSQNWNCYLAELKVRVDPTSDNLMISGYDQSVADSEWKKAVGGASATSNKVKPTLPAAGRN